MGTKVKLTKRAVDALPLPPPGQRLHVHDTEIAGFGMMVYGSGKKTFVLDYGPEYRRRRIKLGNYGSLTPDQARKLALDMLARIAQGADPLEERRRLRSAITFGEWVDEYMVRVRQYKKDGGRKDQAFLAFAKKRWGTRPLDSITAEDIRRLFEHITRNGTDPNNKRKNPGDPRPIHANRWLASVRACLQAAYREGKIRENPAMGKIKPNPENPPRSRVLSDDELARLCDALDKLTNPYVKAAFYLLIETGARLSEVLRAEWEHFDLDARIWRMPRTKTGRPQLLPLTPGVVAMLEGLRKTAKDSPYLFPGRKPGTHLYDLRNPWNKLVKAAQLEGVHIHDLRRTFGLHIARRAGIHVASRLLRHSDIRITERHYAPLGLDDLRNALNARAAEVVELRRKMKEVPEGGTHD